MSTNLTGMNREVYTVPGGSVKTITFNGVDPNYFHIQNNGIGAVYFSAHGIPTKQLYDMKVDGGSISTFADPYPQTEVYIFNPLTEDCNVILTTFRAPFDPVVLAQANRQISIAGTIETDGITKGFECSLPAGNNKIGEVGLSKAVENNIASMVVKATRTNELLENLEINADSINVAIPTEVKQGFSVWVDSDIPYTPPNGYYISKISYINGSPGGNKNLICKAYDSNFDMEIQNPGNVYINYNMECCLTKFVAQDLAPFNITGELTKYPKINETLVKQIVDPASHMDLESELSNEINNLGEYDNITTLVDLGHETFTPSMLWLKGAFYSSSGDVTETRYYNTDTVGIKKFINDLGLLKYQMGTSGTECGWTRDGVDDGLGQITFSFYKWVGIF